MTLLGIDTLSIHLGTLQFGLVGHLIICKPLGSLCLFINQNLILVFKETHTLNKFPTAKLNPRVTPNNATNNRLANTSNLGMHETSEITQVSK